MHLLSFVADKAHDLLTSDPYEYSSSPDDASILNRLATKATACAKCLGVGFALPAIGLPIVTGIAYAAQKFKCIPTPSHPDLLKMKGICNQPGIPLLLYLVLPILEEAVFRGVCQEFVLRRSPKWLVRTLLPGETIDQDDTMLQIGRIFSTAVLFSLAHSFPGNFPTSFIKCQVLTSFLSGLILGTLKESHFGFLGAVGYHLGNNAITVSWLRYMV